MPPPSLIILSLLTPTLIYLWITGFTLLSIIGIGLLIFVAAYAVFAWFAATRIEVPYPSEKELSAEEGKYFMRPSDARLMEYFDINPSGEKIVVFCHGSSSTGRFAEALLIAQDAERLGLRLICPSGPGFGATEAYTDEIQRDPTCCLETYGTDVLALADYINGHAEKVACIGVSFGSEFGFAVAGAAAYEGRLAVYASVVGAVLPNREFMGWASCAGIPFKVLMYICSFEPFARVFVTAAYAPMMRNVPKDALDAMFGFSEEQSGMVAADFARASRHTMQGLVSTMGDWSNVLAAKRQVPAYYSRVCRSGAPVFVHYGTQDKMSGKPNTDFILEQVPHANVTCFEGEHGQFDISMVLEQVSGTI